MVWYTVRQVRRVHIRIYVCVRAHELLLWYGDR